MRILDFEPLTLRGTDFGPRERVDVRVSGTVSLNRRVVATRTGAFKTRFELVGVHRCDQIRVVATGGGGSRATLKYLPAPFCKSD